MDDETIMALYKEAFKIFNHLYGEVSEDRVISEKRLHLNSGWDFKGVMGLPLPYNKLFKFKDIHGRKGLAIKSGSFNDVIFEAVPGELRLIDPSVNIQDIPDQYSRLLSWCGK